MLRRTALESSHNHERWLISYSDFITLLFGFFVVMYAISSVNEGKYRILSHSLMTAFDHDTRSLDPIQVGEPQLSASPHVIDIEDSTGYVDTDEGDTHIEANVEEISERFAGIDNVDQVDVQQNNDWLEINIDSELLFGAGAAQLSPAARGVLLETANYLKGFDNPITVEGYTDNVPSQSAAFPSNWELSAARAASVVRYLVANGVDSERLTAVGYGENHPLETNGTPAGRVANRRVVVVVARQTHVARNLNSGNSSAFALVRGDEPQQIDDSIFRFRDDSGAMIFTNRPATEADESGE